MIKYFSGNNNFVYPVFINYNISSYRISDSIEESFINYRECILNLIIVISFQLPLFQYFALVNLENYSSLTISLWDKLLP